MTKRNPDHYLRKPSQRIVDGDPLLREYWEKREAADKPTKREKGKPINFRIPPSMIAKLKAKASRKGLGYQTLMKLIVVEHLDEY